MDEKWYYQRFDPETFELKHCPHTDLDGAITGHRGIFDLPSWLDENPEERIRLGFIKHIRADRDAVEYNPQTQYLTRSVRTIDAHTVEDVWTVLDKTEDMLLMEELAAGLHGNESIMVGPSVMFFEGE